MMNEQKITKLTLQMGDTITTWEVPHEDVSMDELMDAFHGVCVGQTFVPESFWKACRDFYLEHECLYDPQEEDQA